MKKLIWLIIIAALAFMLYRVWRGESAPPSAEPPLVVSLLAINNSGASGQATLSEVDGQVQVKIELAGTSQETLPQPVHLHKGVCDAIGEPIYTLSSVLNGASETTLPVSLAAIADNLPLVLNVHKSAAEINVYVACGEVTND